MGTQGDYVILKRSLELECLQTLNGTAAKHGQENARNAVKALNI